MVAMMVGGTAMVTMFYVTMMQIMMEE